MACASFLPSDETCGFQFPFGTITSAPLLRDELELFKWKLTNKSAPALAAACTRSPISPPEDLLLG